MQIVENRKIISTRDNDDAFNGQGLMTSSKVRAERSSGTESVQVQDRDSGEIHRSTYLDRHNSDKDQVVEAGAK